jgi:prolyl oligopeptidase
VAVSDTYFGKTYQDPYRWLEDLHDQEAAGWFKAQAVLTDSLLARIPGRDALADEWMALDKLNPARFSDITFEQGRVFYKKTLGGENVGKLYVREGWTGPEKLLFDPSSYQPGVNTVIEAMIPSFDGKRVALALSANGAEVSEIRILDVDQGELLPDRIDSSFGPMGWTPDHGSIFYDSGPRTDPQGLEFHLNRKVRLHRVGAKIEADQDVLSNASHPELRILAKEFPSASIDEAAPGYVIGSASTAQQELRLFIAPAADLRALCEPSDSLVGNITIDRGKVYAVTHTGAPRYRVVRTSLAAPDWRHAETVLPEGPDPVRYTARSKDYLFIVYSNGVTGRLVKYALSTGQSSEVALPASGSVDITCPDAHSNRCIVSITSWTRPTTLFDFDADAGALAKSVFNSDVVYPGFENLVADEVEVPGHDGTLIPLTIIHQKGMKLDGSSCCILEGYGCYGISLTPRFSIQTSIVSHGVVRAFAHVRGGGEKGESWHLAGYKSTKPNTWQDFISCAEYLVNHGYTKPERLAGIGTSAGGILISRAITERPDLFAAALCNVGDANAMRCEFGTDGPSNAMEYGTVKDSAECLALYEMDGVKHVRSGVKYPALMGVGGWNDPRVAPWQPGKFVAAVQNASTSGRPALMKVNYDNGHFTEEKKVTFRNFSAQYAFLLWQAGHPDFQPRP